eukprot:g435.t1
MFHYSQIAFLFLSFVDLFKHTQSHRPVKITLIFDEIQYGDNARFLVEKRVVFLTSSSLFVDHGDVSPRVIEKKLRKLPPFYWGCSVVKFLRIDHIQRGYKHVIVNILRKDCMLLPKLHDSTSKLQPPTELLLPNQNSEINRQYKIGETQHKPTGKQIHIGHGDRKEDASDDDDVIETSTIFIYFFISFFVTVFFAGYALLNLFGFPDITSSLPIKYNRKGISKNNANYKARKLQVKKSKKKKKSTKAIANTYISGMSNNTVNLKSLSGSNFAATLSASDTKDIIETVDLLNLYLPELGKWKAVKTKIDNGKNKTSIALNGNSLSDEDSVKFAFLVKEIVSEEDSSHLS